MIMNKTYLSAHCPVCGKRIYMNSHGYQCECCHFHIPSYVCNRHMEKEEAEAILNGKKIILDGFSTNAGLVFSSIPFIDGDTVRLDNTVANIPGVGRIIVGSKGFVCDKVHGKAYSQFRIQRMYNGHMLTIEEVKTLLRNGSVSLSTFDDNGNPTIQRLRFIKKTQHVAFLKS